LACAPIFTASLPALKNRHATDPLDELNRRLKGWANYFSFGYATSVYREIDWFVRSRLIRHLQRRSQRPFRPPAGVPWYRFLQKLGLVSLARPTDAGNVNA